jgi:uncharacterized protein YkwD
MPASTTIEVASYLANSKCCLKMKRIFLYAPVICILLFTGLVSFVPSNTNSLVEDVLTETNQFRKSKGLPELEVKEELNVIAQQHSNNMAKGMVAFGHAGFEKRNNMAVKSIRTIKEFAENVAFGAATARDAVNMWKSSEGHRKNMLGRYAYIGIGIAKDKQGRLYYTQVFAG